MTTGQIVLLITLVVLIAAMVALYFLGKKAQTRKEEQDQQMAAIAQVVPMLIIDKMIDGEKIDEFLDKPMNNIELVFTAAFVKNHAKIKQKLVDEIYQSCPDKTKLIVALQQMIEECYDSLFDEPSNNEGNASWEVVDLSPKKEK